MMWEYWINLYIGVHCNARGLRCATINAYKDDLAKFRNFVKIRLGDKSPDTVSAKDVLEYIEYMRTEKDNGSAALNRIVTVIKNFYRAMVAMEYLDYRQNPMNAFPKIKARAKKLPSFLDKEEIGKLINVHRSDTVIGIRDRAIITLLYGTGIRASECATMKECDVDLCNLTIKVIGKGGGERALPLNPEVAKVLSRYRMARGIIKQADPFFRSRNKRGMSRNAIFERVRSAARKAKINKVVYPHLIRHTFATHLVRAGVGLVTLRDLLGHRQITSTQVYLHTTAEDLRKAAAVHPVESLVDQFADLLPNMKLPFQWPPGTKLVRAG